MDHREVIQREFAKQARDYAAGVNPSVASPDVLEGMVALAEPTPEAEALDVGTGTGLLARALARRVRRVIGLDLTAAMLAEAVAAGAREGVTNVCLMRGDGAALPFGDWRFDLVATRITFHHMTDPRPILREMVRVARKSGTILVGDMVCAEDPAVAARQNALERARDPSHVRTLAWEELLALGESEGLAARGTSRWTLEVPFARWARMSSTPAEVAAQIRTALTEDIGKGQTGFQPFLRDGELYFIHEWGAVNFGLPG